ncbi:MAG: pap [Deferribacteraceae bacterium]|jgi:polyphosphate kinase 2 (PPK2 family)|nr:pap [Deferribacteraceae bacterium]
MFEAVELNQSISKQEFRNKLEEIRGELVRAQIDSRKHNGPIIFIILGVDGAGKGELVNFLGTILDIRNVRIEAFCMKPTKKRKDLFSGNTG